MSSKMSSPHTVGKKNLETFSLELYSSLPKNSLNEIGENIHEEMDLELEQKKKDNILIDQNNEESSYSSSDKSLSRIEHQQNDISWQEDININIIAA